jgi:hypothetical protein
MVRATDSDMARSDLPQPRAVGHGTDIDEESAWPGGAQPTGEPREQDSAGGGRGIGLGLTTIVGGLLIAVPMLWAITYLAQAGNAGLGTGFTFLVGAVLLFCLGVGVVLVRGLFRT